MKTSQKLLTLTLSFLAVAFLTSCGTKKSDATAQVSNNSVITNEPGKVLANCNHLYDTNFSMNVAVVTDASGKINANWIKVKFDYVSSNVAQNGYTVRFYKWRVMGSNAQMDSNPLQFSTYLLSSGQTNSNTMTAAYTSYINAQNGFYINLNDDANYPYQVLKVVAYKSDGTVAAQSDILIPQFLASPADYKYNSDGSLRATNLLNLHPLNGVDVSSWTQDQLAQSFAQYCF